MGETKIWAHRGASGYAPENTIPSFQLAIDQHADGIELDIQLTKDNEIIVLHDETINRTTEGSGWVKDLTLKEIKELNANYQNGAFTGSTAGEKINKEIVYPEYDHVYIPAMEEVLELIKPTDMVINIEIKTGIVFYQGIEERIIDLVKNFGMEDRVIYSSFNHYTVKKIMELDKNAKTGFLYADGPIDIVGYAKEHGVYAIHPAIYNLQYEGVIKRCKEENLKIHTWTVNEREHLMMAKSALVDAVITNYPDLAREIIG